MRTEILERMPHGILRCDAAVEVPDPQNLSSSDRVQFERSFTCGSDCCTLCKLFPAQVNRTAGKSTVSARRVSHVAASKDEACELFSRYSRLWDSLSSSADCSALYDLAMEGMDEVTRQLTLSCSDQGILLRKLREEATECFSDQQRLMDSLVHNEVRRCIEASVGRSSVASQSDKASTELTELKAELERRKLELSEFEASRSAEFDKKDTEDEVELTALSAKFAELSAKLETALGAALG